MANWNQSKENSSWNKPFLKYNAADINKDVPIESAIAKYAGYTVQRNNTIRCPNPEHPDSHPSAHIYHDKNKCRCYSCNESFSPIDIAMKNCNLSFPEACEQLVQDFGLDKRVYTNISEIEAITQARAENRFYDSWYFNDDEIKNIGLESNINKSTVKVDANKYFEAVYGLEPLEKFEGKTFDISIDTAVRYEFAPPNLPETLKKMPSSMQMMWSQGNFEDKISMEDMILGKCDETIEKANDIKDYYKHSIKDYFEKYTPEVQDKLLDFCKKYVEKGLELEEKNDGSYSLPVVKNKKIENAMAETFQVYNYMSVIQDKVFDHVISSAEETRKKVENHRRQREADMQKHPQKYRTEHISSYEQNLESDR